MSEITRYHLGEPVDEWPGESWNLIAAVVEELRREGLLRTPREGAISPVLVLITETIPAGEADGVLTVQEFEAEILYENSAGKYARSGETITCLKRLTTAVTVASGKGRLGETLAGILLNADCEEIDLTDLTEA